MYPSITAAAAALRRGETTSVGLVTDSFSATSALNPILGAFVSRLEESALAAAEVADRERESGIDRGPLHGIPLAVKDIIRTDGSETRAQSDVLSSEWSAGEEAPAVTRLRDAGAIITGKTSTMEFALGFPEPEKSFPLPRNPWNPEHWTGGSSSGTAVAVSAGLVLGGLGTDTGGSIRWPAAACGVTGFKPTFGLVPNRGVLPLGFTFDHVGPLARTAVDAAHLLEAIAGFDSQDVTSVHHDLPDLTADLPDSLSGLTIGVTSLAEHTSFALPELESVFEAAVAVLEDAGARVVRIELPLYEEMRTVTMLGSIVEAYAFHRDDLIARWDDYGPTSRMGFVKGALVTGGDYLQMQRARRVAQRRVATLFSEVDAIVTPTIARAADRYGAFDFAATVDSMHTSYWDALGNPAMSVPMGFSDDGLPLGLQIIAAPFAERRVVEVGNAFQQRTSFHELTPALVSHLSEHSR